MSNRANLREMKSSEQNAGTANYIKTNPLSFHIQNDKNDSRCCISAIGMNTHYLNNSIGDSEELVENSSRNNIKKKKVNQITQKYNSGRFQYSSQEGNPNYSSLSNSDFPDEKTSKGYYKTNVQRNDFKSNSKSKKRKISKRTRSSNKAHENAQTPISMNKIIKTTNLNEFTGEIDSIEKRKRRKTQGLENAILHQKNISDNSIMYTSHSCGPNIQELIDSKVSMHASTGLQPSYSPYVSNNGNTRKGSQRSKSTNSHIVTNINNKLNCSEGFVNIDLSLLPHDMTQREVVETMIRKHEISNIMYSDEDEDTTRYMMQNPDDRRTCRRSQYNKNENKEESINTKESISPVDLQKRIILGSKSNSIECKTASVEYESIKSNRHHETTKNDIIMNEVVEKLTSDMSQNLEYLEN